jgi:glutathione S-transferase
MTGKRVSCADLSIFSDRGPALHAFPERWRASRLASQAAVLCEQVAQRPSIAAYLASKRRIAFSQDDIFRHYPELDQA